MCLVSVQQKIIVMNCIHHLTIISDHYSQPIEYFQKKPENKLPSHLKHADRLNSIRPNKHQVNSHSSIHILACAPYALHACVGFLN